MTERIKEATRLMIKHHYGSIDRAMETAKGAERLASEAHDIKAVLVYQDIQAELIKQRR